MRDGALGVGPRAVRPDDCVVVLYGGKVPYIVRESGPSYEFVGECYVKSLH